MYDIVSIKDCKLVSDDFNKIIECALQFGTDHEYSYYRKGVYNMSEEKKKKNGHFGENVRFLVIFCLCLLRGCVKYRISFDGRTYRYRLPPALRHKAAYSKDRRPSSYG